MKTVQINLYKFNELSDEAKQTALDNFTPFTDHIQEDAKNTRDAFCKLFDTNEDGDLTTYNQNAEDLRGFRLRKYILNNYGDILYKGKYYGTLVRTHKDGSAIEVSKQHPAGLRHVTRYSKVIFVDRNCNLTGMCYDDCILEPLYKFIEQPDEVTSLSELFYSCFASLQQDIEDEQNYILSDKGKSDELSDSDQDFTEDGELY